jgi:hypothetical protein
MDKDEPFGNDCLKCDKLEHCEYECWNQCPVLSIECKTCENYDGLRCIIGCC